jgi:hypothetical protein
VDVDATTPAVRAVSAGASTPLTQTVTAAIGPHNVGSTSLSAPAFTAAAAAALAPASVTPAPIAKAVAGKTCSGATPIAGVDGLETGSPLPTSQQMRDSSEEAEIWRQRCMVLLILLLAILYCLWPESGRCILSVARCRQPQQFSALIARLGGRPPRTGSRSILADFAFTYVDEHLLRAATSFPRRSMTNFTRHMVIFTTQYPPVYPAVRSHTPFT